MISLKCLPFFFCRYGTFLSFKVGIQPTSIGLKMLPQTSIFARIMLPNYVGRMIHRVAIVGGGIMGTGIAKMAAGCGNSVCFYDQQFKELQETREYLEKRLERIAENIHAGDKGKMADYIRETKANLNYTTDPKLAFSDVDLVIEAIHEKEEAKTRLFAKVDAHTTDSKTIFATNTVSLSVANIASHVHRKDKFIGIRFFYPVPQTIVAEITRTVETSDETVKKVTDWVTSLGKYPVQLTDAPGGGGIIHRLPHFQKAFSQLSRGNAPLEELDLAMKHSLGLHQGPFRIMDEIGLDVFLNVLETLVKKYPNEAGYTVPNLLRTMVKKGKLGVKSGEGFYTYK